MSAPDTKQASPATEDAQNEKRDTHNLRDSRRVVNSIKAELGDIPSLWQRLNLHGEPPQRDGVCHSPFRQEKRPSFSIYEDGQKWKDHAEGTGGDTLDFYAMAHGISNEDAISELRGEGRPLGWNESIRDTTHSPPAKPKQKQPKREPIKFELDAGSISEMNHLRYQRALDSWAGLEVLFDRGLFGFTWLWDNGQRVRAWVVTDSARCGAQARRLDGRPWSTRQGTTKSKPVPGYGTSWPIGSPRAPDADVVIVTEGETDMLAAATWALYAFEQPTKWEIVCCVGSSRIDRDALPFFQGKDVVIYADHDENKAGSGHAQRRYQQLSEAGARVRIMQPGRAGKDLNDVISTSTFYADDDDEGRVS